MMNQIVLVGRLVNDPIIQKEREKDISIISLAVPRPYKNVDGEYETDFIDCILWQAVAGTTCEYCKKGDVVGVRGRLQTRTVDDKKITEVIAERITFLSSKKEEK